MDEDGGPMWTTLHPPKGMCSERQEGMKDGSEEGRGWVLGVGPCPSLCTCSWLRQGPYLSFTQVIGDEPDEDRPRARVGQGG